jgi:hypothetical protein
MSGKERRLSPRRDCMVPLRFRILANAPADYAVAGGRRRDDFLEGTAGHFGPLHGEVVNLSAGGIGFKSRQKLVVGDRLEIYLSIPPALPGGNFQDVCCEAMIIRVDDRTDVRGLTGVGAIVDLFASTAATQARWN